MQPYKGGPKSGIGGIQFVQEGQGSIKLACNVCGRCVSDILFSCESESKLYVTALA